MKSYHLKVNLPNFEKIQNYFSTIVKNNDDINDNKIIWLTDTDVEWLNRHIDLTHITKKNNKIIGAFLFIVKPNNNPTDYHIDGTDIDINLPKWALNIPIINCENGEMLWADGDYDIVKKEENGIPWLEVVWNTDPIIVQSFIIDSPSIVKIDVPHKVINHKNCTRIMLTVRFAPDLF